MQLLFTYSKETRTTINEDGNEVCLDTACAYISQDKIIAAYTQVAGGSLEENAKKLGVCGYEFFRNERERESEVAHGLQWQSENTSTFIVNSRLLDEVEDLKETIDSRSL
jgi:hypothetical protein